MDAKDNKTPLLAAVEVGGHVRTAVVSKAVAKTVLPFLLLARNGVTTNHVGAFSSSSKTSVRGTPPRYFASLPELLRFRVCFSL